MSENPTDARRWREMMGKELADRVVDAGLRFCKLTPDRVTVNGVDLSGAIKSLTFTAPLFREGPISSPPWIPGRRQEEGGEILSLVDASFLRSLGIAPE